MKIGILQPGYLPWIGFFEQVYRVDKFVLYDNVQYTRKDWRNRNQIKTSKGAMWLTVPVERAVRGAKVMSVKIDYKQNWQKKHLTSIKVNYIKTPYFKQYFPILEDIISNKFVYLQDLDNKLISVISEMLGIKREFILSSSLGLKESDKNFKIIEICKNLHANFLYDGKSSRSFIDIELFKKNGIDVIFQDYKYPVYHQLFGEFVPYLSVIDLLFNHGPESLDIIIGKKVIK